MSNAAATDDTVCQLFMDTGKGILILVHGGLQGNNIMVTWAF